MAVVHRAPVSPALRNPLFHLAMSGRRYEQLKATIHFLQDTDYPDEPRAGDPLYDRSLKVRLVREVVISRTKHFFRCGKAMTLDESMTACKCTYAPPHSFHVPVEHVPLVCPVHLAG